MYGIYQQVSRTIPALRSGTGSMPVTDNTLPREIEN